MAVTQIKPHAVPGPRTATIYRASCATGLAQKIEDDASIFLNLCEFAEAVKWFPLGAIGNMTEIPAVVVEDFLEGNFQVPGDGRVLDRDASRQLRETLYLEIDASHAVTVPTGKDISQDVFEIAGETWYAKRILGRDAGMQTVMLVKAREFIRRRGEQRG